MRGMEIMTKDLIYVKGQDGFISITVLDRLEFYGKAGAKDEKKEK
jgi:hypothetical protein